VATTFGAFAAIAIENAQLYDQAQREIEERLVAERSLELERSLLTQRVAAQTADLRAANEEMARAARHKDEFLAAMSHELRTPLNTILGMSELLLETVYGEMNERQRRGVSNIRQSGEHLLALINDVLDVARIAAGQMQLELNVASVDDICRSSINLVQAAADNKQIAIDYVMDRDVTALHVDARRIRQVLVNLLSNAVKFTPPGATIGLTVAAATDRSVVRFTVWDRGIGIAPDDMARLFQPFVQLDSSLARRYEGTGLGLTIVHRLVQRRPHRAVEPDQHARSAARSSPSTPSATASWASRPIPNLAACPTRSIWP
jgi:signal transduction histidine kinase